MLDITESCTNHAITSSPIFPLLTLVFPFWQDGKAKIPAKGFRSSARLGGGSDVPLGDPKVYDEEFKKIECHQQVGFGAAVARAQLGPDILLFLCYS